MVLPSERDIRLYVGSWEEWMRSAGVSWDDARELEYLDDPCPGCFGDYDEPLSPFLCSECPFAEECREETRRRWEREVKSDEA